MAHNARVRACVCCKVRSIWVLLFGICLTTNQMEYWCQQNDATRLSHSNAHEHTQKEIRHSMHKIYGKYKWNRTNHRFGLAVLRSFGCSLSVFFASLNNIISFYALVACLRKYNVNDRDEWTKSQRWWERREGRRRANIHSYSASAPQNIAVNVFIVWIDHGLCRLNVRHTETNVSVFVCAMLCWYSPKHLEAISNFMLKPKFNRVLCCAHVCFGCGNSSLLLLLCCCRCFNFQFGHSFILYVNFSLHLRF